MDWPTGVRERDCGAVLSWSVAQGWREDPCAELRSRQECVGSAACGAQEGRSEPAEKGAAGLVLQQPDRSPFLLPSSCPPSFLQCPGTAAPHGHPQLWSLLRRGTRGRAQRELARSSLQMALDLPGLLVRQEELAGFSWHTAQLPLM